LFTLPSLKFTFHALFGFVALVWAKFAKRDKGLWTFLSSEDNHHGSKNSKTEVPRRTLVEELTKHSHFVTTNLKKEDRDPKNGMVLRSGTVTWVEETFKV
jgi:hypothetical protein